jgi:hypothetical protein
MYLLNPPTNFLKAKEEIEALIKSEKNDESEADAKVTELQAAIEKLQQQLNQDQCEGANKENAEKKLKRE